MRLIKNAFVRFWPAIDNKHYFFLCNNLFEPTESHNLFPSAATVAFRIVETSCFSTAAIL